MQNHIGSGRRFTWCFCCFCLCV